MLEVVRTPKAGKPPWVDGDDNGQHKCRHCSYSSHDVDFLKEHTDCYHPGPPISDLYALYLKCEASLGRNKVLSGMVSANEIGTIFEEIGSKGKLKEFVEFDDDDLKQFGDELVQASRETGIKLIRVFRAYQAGIDSPDWWVDAGIKAGVFQEYTIPEEVVAKEDDDETGSREDERKRAGALK